MTTERARLLEVTKETRKLAFDVNIIVRTNLHIISTKSMEKKHSLFVLFDILSGLTDRLCFSETVATNELAQNHYEFLDTLKTIIGTIDDEAISKSLSDMKTKIDSLIYLLNTPPFLTHQLIRRKNTDLESDVDDTEPKNIKFITFGGSGIFC